jgi:phosphohistidine phosphatase
MRHAKSDWSSPGLSDHDRQLNARGCRAAPLMADFLLKQGLQADVILVSSAVRAQQTLERLRPTWSSEAVVWTVPSLYLASPEEITKQIHGLHDSWHRAMVIGHNPGLSALASQLSGQAIELPTAAVALFSSPADNWCGALAAHPWKLEALWKPRELEN